MDSALHPSIVALRRANRLAKIASKQERVRPHVRDGKPVQGYSRKRVGGSAEGIPDRNKVAPISKVEGPTEWEFGVHDHRAERAGRHFDLRLGDPNTKHAHSWAIPKAKLPEQGETLLAVQQPTHTIEYMDFRGVIKEGYGKGEVKLHLRSNAEVLAADNNFVRFNLYEGRVNQEFALIRTVGKNWICINVTPKRKKDVPDSKPKYKSVDPADVDFADEDQVLQAKIDGAHVLVDMTPGKQTRVTSYRPGKNGVIDHTWRVQDIIGHRTTGKRSLFRAELFAEGADGKALPPEKVGGILNAGVRKSREMQAEQGKLRLALIDVVKHNGEDFSEKPYAEKLQAIQSVATPDQDLFLIPPTARTQDRKSVV